MVPSSIVITLLTPVLIALCTIALILFVMRSRRFYFVRHGETLQNAEHIKQGDVGGLSELGKKQATAIGRVLTPLHIKKIISSPFERTRETTVILREYIHVPVVYSPLLAERRSPAEIIGKHTHDPKVIRVVDQMDYAYHDDNYRYADEENFADLKKRAKKCLSMLMWQGGRTTCVVTHHAFLKMLLSYMLYGKNLHASDYIKLSFFNTSDNGGISICDFHPWKRFSSTGGWEIVSYNEQPV